MADTNPLIDLAIKASEQAYVPYSHFPVGAAIKTADGKVYQGCNIENASFGLTNCAERTAIFKAVSEGHRDIVEMAVFAHTDRAISPCGACRQVMTEFLAANAKVTLISRDSQTVVMTVEELLPYYFTDSDMSN